MSTYGSVESLIQHFEQDPTMEVIIDDEDKVSGLSFPALIHQ